MIRSVLLAVGLLALNTGVYSADKADLIQGNWLGEWTSQGGGGGKTLAEIRGLGNGEYQATFTAYDSGEQDKGVFTFSILGSSVSSEQVTFTQQIDLGLLGMFSFEAHVENEQLVGKYSNGKQFDGTLELKRVVTPTPEVGTRPLPGAVVLFDGTSLKKWIAAEEGAEHWRIQDGNLVALAEESAGRPARGHLATVDSFGDAQLHVEFRVPYLPELRGAERGDSGLWLWGRYELQIADNFGQPRPRGADGEFSDIDAIGAIYKQRAPLEMPTRPPGEWQAFDITLRAERKDSSGNISQPAEITVLLNGVLIHDRVPLNEPTTGSDLSGNSPAPGLVLEHAGQPIEFRNIWYVPLDTPSAR